MGIVLVGTAGLCIWIVLWATNLFSGFDSIMIGIVMVLLAIAVRGVLPHLLARRS